MTQVQALSILKTGANVFLTGEPGSGKTHVINEYAAYLRRRGIEPAITASTGIAATHVGGMTIHSWGGIGIKTRLDRRDLAKIAASQHVVRRVRRAKVLIIEEVSMLSPETLSMVDVVCREIKQSQKPFGGTQVVFVGDFFQLPPIVRREADDRARAAGFAYDSPAWKETNPTICYLTEQHRQDDTSFLDILSAVRRNSFREDHLNYIKTRKIESRTAPENVPKLFSHNADVDRINDAVLAKIPGKPKEFVMSGSGPDALTAALKRGCLSPEMLYLKVGAAVMFTKNNLKEGFVNGTLGTVVGFAKTSGHPLVKTRNGRQIEVEPMDWSMEENGRVRAQISQLPLRLAWAVTVHKSQGMSLDAAVMDLSDVFEFGQGYVALSRIRRLSGLFIIGWNKRAFQVHPKVLENDKAFRFASSNAEAKLSKISPVELDKKQDSFIAACGGKSRSAGKEKLDTYRQTWQLWNEEKSVVQIAKARGLKEGTILGHIEKLFTKGRINPADLSRLITPSLARALPKIHAAFCELGTDKLSPVFEKLGGAHSYDQLRIARLALIARS